MKDDFFDSLSCDALDAGSHNGRTRFSDQLKKDTEVFLLSLEGPCGMKFKIMALIPNFLLTMFRN